MLPPTVAASSFFLEPPLAGWLVRVGDNPERPRVLDSQQADPAPPAPLRMEIVVDNTVVHTLQGEVERQCRFAIMSLELMNQGLAGLTQAHEVYVQQSAAFDLAVREDRSFDEVNAQRDETNALQKESSRLTWYSIQGFLIAAANLSKLLWGTEYGKAERKKRRAKERAALRASLGVEFGSILRLSPVFRNHFEHLSLIHI